MINNLQLKVLALAPGDIILSRLVEELLPNEDLLVGSIPEEVT